MLYKTGWLAFYCVYKRISFLLDPKVGKYFLWQNKEVLKGKYFSLWFVFTWNILVSWVFLKITDLSIYQILNVHVRDEKGTLRKWLLAMIFLKMDSSEYDDIDIDIDIFVLMVWIRWYWYWWCWLWWLQTESNIIHLLLNLFTHHKVFMIKIPIDYWQVLGLAQCKNSVKLLLHQPHGLRLLWHPHAGPQQGFIKLTRKTWISPFSRALLFLRMWC